MFFLSHNFSKLFLIIILLLLKPFLASPAAVKYLGQPKKAELIVRIDSNISSPAIGKITKDTVLEIIGEAYGWYKIILPKSIPAYVWNKYLRLKANGKAIVKVNNLNIRLNPSLNSYVIGKLNKGDKVNVIERKNNWDKIIPYPYAYGWVYSKMVNKITSLGPDRKTEKKNTDKNTQDIRNKSAKNTTINQQQQLPPVAWGVLEIFKPENGCPANYCIRNKQGVLLIKANPLEIFNRDLLGKKVKIWGKVKKKSCIYLDAALIRQ